MKLILELLKQESQLIKMDYKFTISKEKTTQIEHKLKSSPKLPNDLPVFKYENSRSKPSRENYERNANEFNTNFPGKA